MAQKPVLRGERDYSGNSTATHHGVKLLKLLYYFSGALFLWSFLSFFRQQLTRFSSPCAPTRCASHAWVSRCLRLTLHLRRPLGIVSSSDVSSERQHRLPKAQCKITGDSIVRCRRCPGTRDSRSHALRNAGLLLGRSRPYNAYIRDILLRCGSGFLILSPLRIERENFHIYRCKLLRPPRPRLLPLTDSLFSVHVILGTLFHVRRPCRRRSFSAT